MEKKKVPVKSRSQKLQSELLPLLAEQRQERATRRDAYELTYLIAARFTEEELIPLRTAVANFATSFGATEIKEEILGKKKLAYPIDHATHGYYMVMRFEMPVSKASQLSQRLEHNSDILRHILIRTKPENYTRRNVSKRQSSDLEDKDSSHSKSEN